MEYLYRELRTLSYMGASVLNTDAVLPVSDLDIPINIRNTNRPHDPGSMIVRKLPKDKIKYSIIAVPEDRYQDAILAIYTAIDRQKAW